MPLLTIVPILGYVLLWRRLAQAAFAASAIHAASAILLVLYLGSLAGILHATALLVLGAGTVIAVYELSVMARRRSPLAVPAGVLLGLPVLFWVIHNGGAFAYYDEYAHWGIYIKEMLATNQLWGADSNAMHLRYVPGPPLWQYLFLTLGGPLAGGAFLAQFCLLIIPLLVLWQGMTWRQLPWIVAVFALVALALSNFGHGFASLYVDHVLGAWFAGTLFCFLLDSEDRSPARLTSYALPVATMVLLKDAGLYFAFAATGIMALVVFWKRAFEGKERRIRDGLLSASLVGIGGLAAAVLVTVSWNMNRDALEIPQATVSVGGIISGIVSGESNLTADEQVELQRRFRDVVVDQQISKNEISAMYNAYTYGIKPQFTDRFRLTIAWAVVLFVIWQVIAIAKLVSKERRGRWGIVGAGMLATLCIYLAVLLLSYRFAFEDRGLSLSSFVRYVHTALLPMFLFVFLPLLPAFREPGEHPIELPGGRQLQSGATIFAALLLVSYAVETPYLKPLYRAHEAPPVYTQLLPLSKKVADVVGDKRLWVYFPVPDSNGLIGRIIRFQMTPVTTEVAVDPNTFTDDPELMARLVNEWDYLWFPIQDPVLDEQLHFYFGDDLKQRLFRIERTDTSVTVQALDGVF